jgi:predicted transcriptional regulator
MQDVLINLGLTEAQAMAYVYLLENGEVSPPALASDLDFTRSNAYKVLDSLVELGLLLRHEINKKFVYAAADPEALNAMVAKERQHVTRLEQEIAQIQPTLYSLFRSTSGQFVEVYKGSPAVEKQRKNALKHSDSISKTQTDMGIEWITSTDMMTIIRNGSSPIAVQISDKTMAQALRELLDNTQS